MAMLTEMIGQGASLVWRQPSMLTQHFDLHLGPADDAPVVAALDFKGGLAALASAASAAGYWDFTRSGFWRPKIGVYNPADGAEMARFARQWGGGGTLATGWGPSFRWVASNFWRTRWEWLTADGRPLLRFSDRRKLMRLQAQVEVAAPLNLVPELDLLCTLGWYLFLTQARDDSAAQLATAAS